MRHRHAGRYIEEAKAISLSSFASMGLCAPPCTYVPAAPAPGEVVGVGGDAAHGGLLRAVLLLLGPRDEGAGHGEGGREDAHVPGGGWVGGVMGRRR